MHILDSKKAVWILVADGSKARVFKYLGAKRAPEMIKNGEFEHMNKPTRDIAQERRGRVFQSADGARSAMERPSDPHEYEKSRFAAQLADFLDHEHKKNQFGHLVVVAPPKSLGALRQHFSKSLMSAVEEEIDKDLTNVKAGDLPKHLKSVLNFNI